MIIIRARAVVLLLGLLASGLASRPALAQTAPTQTSLPRPNIVLIYADDVGYGDVSAYGATRLRTPHIDRLAAEGLRFTDAHAAAATCTPSRYALLTGQYAWRQPGTGVLPGSAALIIDPARPTLPRMLQRAGYVTGIVGKWHLGLGPTGGPDWNHDITPGPLDVGFTSSFIMAATGDRVPTVYVENRRVVGLDPRDPITVSYDKPVGDWPTGRANPDRLTLHPSHGHDQTIVNGISRIGYMTGGKAALWTDEDMADVFTRKAVAFLEAHRAAPFFLMFALHDIHVPRVPHARFRGVSGMGARGDVIAQMDWSVGEILAALDRLGLASNTLVIFTSDNGPVVDDGYKDEAVAKLGTHAPAGPFRGGKYSNFEGGTRVPWLLRWPARVKPAVSDALISQVDLFASLAALTGQAAPAADSASDTENVLPALLGVSTTGRADLVLQAGALSLREGPWKYITPGKGARINANTNTELGNDPLPQLYDLRADPGERTNLAATNPAQTRKLAARLDEIREKTGPAIPARPTQKAFVDLAYPADALASRVTGAVVVRVTTDPSGRVVEAEALSGPAALRPDAVANARQWTLAPGDPTAIVYRFEIEDGACNDDGRSLFRLVHSDLAVITACTGPGRGRPPEPDDEVRIEDFGQGQFPFIAQSVRVFGIVVLDLSIDRGGRVTDVRVLNRAQPLLRPAAVAHAKTWRIQRPAPRRGIVVYEFAEERHRLCPPSATLFWRVTNDYVRFSACPPPLAVSLPSHEHGATR